MAKDLLDSEFSDSDDGGAQLETADFKVNQDFARKFEHNKKREERQRLEDKWGHSLKRKRDNGHNENQQSSDESTSESEDEGELATKALDTEILATIDAIRSKDPRVYDSSAKFYSSIKDGEPTSEKPDREKPMHLQDYHRQNLLAGQDDEEEGDHQQPLSYNQEQENLKRSIVQEIHAAASSESDSSASDSQADFLVAKKKSKWIPKDPILDVENADKDPETYLSNFMRSRAWEQPVDRNLQPFESDDEDEERRAEEFEEAYNMRFEDPAKSNEKLRSHARDLAAQYSVRRKEENPRQKRREGEKSDKEAARQQLREEKARLRKLRVEEVEERVRRIKRAAGLHTKDLKPEDWSRFVDEDWDDGRWEGEMQRRFGDNYYAEADQDSDDAAEMPSKRKPKKPKFDDDIDIKDIVPDYEDEEDRDFSLSEDELEVPNQTEVKRPKQQKKKMEEEKKRDARKERRIIEHLVDEQLQVELDHNLPRSRVTPSGFRYRATSPQSFGLTSRDILLADDSHLNQFAGLKKLAAFRDPTKKQKDKKHLGKRARLRQWRKEVFGDEDGFLHKELVPPQPQQPPNGDIDEKLAEDGNVITGKKKRRRGNKKPKTVSVEE